MLVVGAGYVVVVVRLVVDENDLLLVYGLRVVSTVSVVSYL